MAKNANENRIRDQVDRTILALVQRDASMAQADIARHVGLSAAAVNERLKKLENAGVIRRYAAIVDPVAVGTPITAFIEVFIEHPRHEPRFLDTVLKLEEVQECHHITGEFSLLIKVKVRDMQSLQALLLERLSGFEGVRQTRTVMVLSTVKEDCYVATGARPERAHDIEGPHHVASGAEGRTTP